MPPKRRKLLGRRTAAASAARAARASETPEQTSLPLSCLVSSSAARLSMESAAARTEKLASAASTMSAHRARLSVEECSLQNSQDAVHVARLRASQSPAQKTLRRLNTRATAASRASEQPQAAAHRCISNALFTASARALESPAQTTVHRVRNARSTASARALEIPAQTTVRRVRNARSTASARAAENSEREPPQFLQIYFLADYNEQVNARLGILPSEFSVGRRRDILFRLQDMLHETNSYIRSLKFALQNNSSPSFSVVIDADRRLHGEHERRFNAPVCNEIAAVIHGEEHNSRDIVIRYRGGGLLRISETHRSYDCLQYPLLFPYGSDGYHFKIPIYQAINDSISTSKTVSCRAYYAYVFMVREGEFNHLHKCRQLFLQFAVDMAAKMESERLGFIMLNQSKLRTDSYIHLRDGLRSDGDPHNLGKPCILPSSYTGGPRYMYERTQDAMIYVRHYGRPDLFVTFTCNLKWVEITRELFPGQQYSHRPGRISCVFRLQLCKLMDLILKGQVFGRVKCHMYTVEWQKRGLPHAHILLWLNDKVDANKIDDFISAEIPDPALDPLLHKIIKNYMIHGPCGANYEKRLCWSSGSTCAKVYPVSLSQKCRLRRMVTHCTELRAAEL
ncbi:unnamed protein product [Acanthosepion pharaonis]|uniref:Helitron helicase-like domain-containing protein n=1 Tax=Acanthosepion pharaonis TaxID=158019 RepID=A0A812CSS4_ACAPH|nr:unnamed protein product [Sepia pharaonis]